jgi:hypothetical protein
LSQVQVLLVGLKPEFREQFIRPLQEVGVHRCDDKAGLKSLMERKHDLDFQVVICGNELAEFNIPEIAQTARMLYPTAKLMYAVDKVDGFDRKLWIKNGFDDVFLLPLDQSIFSQAISASIAEAEEQMYAPVRLVDIGAGTQLDFEIRIFLNRNNKFVSYSNVADILDEARLERLKIYRVKDVFIPVKQLQKYYSFSAQRLIELSNESSEPEKQKMLSNSCRELIGSMLNESYAKSTQSKKKVFDHTKTIIDQYLSLKYSDETKERIQNQPRKNDPKSSKRVSYFAVLFSLVLGCDLEDPKYQQVILAAARFDELTNLEANQTPLSPDQAFRIISTEKILEPNLVASLSRMFEKEAFQHIA